MDRILQEAKINARDQNKVFVEYANADALSPRDAEKRHRLKRGKGNAYVEFDADDDEVNEQTNQLTGKREFFLRGDVDLTSRSPEGADNA
jgi:hypothetical protein